MAHIPTSIIVVDLLLYNYKTSLKGVFTKCIIYPLTFTLHITDAIPYKKKKKKKVKVVIVQTFQNKRPNLKSSVCAIVYDDLQNVSA